MQSPRRLARRLVPLAATSGCLLAAVVPLAPAQGATAAPDRAAGEVVALVNPTVPTRLEVNLAATPGLETCLPVAGTEVLPPEATGVVVNVTTVAPAGDGYVVVYPSGGQPTGSTVNFDTGFRIGKPRDVANAAFVALGPDGAFCYRTQGAVAGIIVDVTGYTLPEDGVELQTPERLLDTRRTANFQVGEIEGPVQERTPYEIQVAGTAGVPADAESVLLNVTVTGALSEGNLRVYPGGEDVPDASVVNFAPESTRAVATIVRLSDQGTVSFWSDSPLPAITSQVNVIVDVVGWTTAGSPYVPLTPTRALDTRTGVGLAGLPGQVGTPARIPGGQGLAFRVTGAATGVPEDAAAVVLNLAAVHPDRPGNLRVHLAGFPVPETSTINYIPGLATANLAVVPLPVTDDPAAGLVALWSDSTGSVDVVADVIGYVAARPAD